MIGYDRCLDCKNFTQCDICDLIDEIPEEELLNRADIEPGPWKDWTVSDFIKESLPGFFIKILETISRK